MPFMTSPASTPSRLHQNVWVMTFTSFLTDISSEMLVNLIPLFLTGVLGARTWTVGLIEGVAETTASLLKIFSGAISDKLKQRKWLAVLGYALSALSKPFYYLANTWGWVLGIRFSDRLGKGIRTAPRDVLIAGSVNAQNRGLAFGIQRAGDTAGAFLGILIAAVIIWLTQANTAKLTSSTFKIIVLASIIPAVLAVILLAVGAKEIHGTKTSTLPVFTFKGLEPRFKAYLIAVILFTFGNSADAFVILRAQERGLSLLQIMAMLLTFNAIYALLSGPAGALSDRIGRRKLILFGWLAYGLIYLGFAFSKTGTAIWLLYGFYGLYYAATEGSGKALIADLVTDEKRGTAYGLYSAAVGITALPASLIAGVLWQGLGKWGGLGPAAPFAFGASMAILAGVWFFFRVR